MVTGMEMDQNRAILSIAGSMIELVKELQRLNDKLDFMTGKGQINVFDVSKV